jgi:hypothetical protein
MNPRDKLMRILRIDERLAAVDMPTVGPAGDIDLMAEDSLVVCAGFEDRSLGVLRSLTSCVQVTVVLVEYRPYLLGNRLEDCLSECSRLGVAPIRYVYDRENPAGAAIDIWSLLAKARGRIHIDLSGMSRLLIVQLLAASATERRFSRITLLYTEPEQYYPLRDQVQAVESKSAATAIEFLSWGVSEITVVPELSSVALPDQPTHLIAFPSFDAQQLAAVRKDVEPARISIILGTPLPAHGDWRLQAVRDLNCKSSQRGLREFVTSTYDYRETLNLLLELYSGGQRLDKVVISPTGSKMQTVAVGVLRAFLSDVKVVYPTPRSFATGAYTVGIRRIHQLSLDAFGSVSNPSP